MDSKKFPLLKLFYQLRHQGFHLTPDDYTQVLEILADPAPTDFELTHWQSVFQLCRCLWVKSQEQEQLFSIAVAEIEGQYQRTLPRHLKLEDKPLLDISVQPPPPDLDLRDEPPPPTAPAPPAPPPNLPEAPEVVKAIGRIAQPRDGYPRFQVPDTYIPPSRQKMRQTWQTLYQPQFFGPPSQLDLDSTLWDIRQKGMYFDLKFKPPRHPGTELLLLLDQQGSMTPFHSLTSQLRETLVHEGQLAKITVYYFENYPTDELYCDPKCEQGKGLNWVFSRLDPQNTVTLIFSDGGAAKGTYRPHRLEETLNFLNRLHKYSGRIAWLNPMPKSRWCRTTAEDIRTRVKMFECNTRGFMAAITYLEKGAHASIKKLRGNQFSSV